MKTAQQRIEEIQKLEIEIGKLQAQQGGTHGNLFPKILKLTRKLQKLREKL